jgi:cytoskeletal protein CcmA (bactofilin family)
MALFNKDKTHDATPAAFRPEGIAPREVEMGERDRTTQFGGGGIDAFLGKGTKVTGKLVLEGAGRIEGQVEGEIAAQDTLTIGEGANVGAKISGSTIVVEGKVTGDVVARQRLEIRATGRVHGNVSTPSLIVHEGAVLDGQCSMGAAAEPKGIKRDEPDAATRNLERARDAAMQVAASVPR